MIDRRGFLARAAVTAGAALAGCRRDTGASDRVWGAADPGSANGWVSVRRQFDLSEDVVHLAALLLASNPRPVRDAIETYRRALDRDPVTYLSAQNARLRRATREAAAAYLGARADDLALTDSTTMGLGLVYNGLRLPRGAEILTTEHDYYVTHESVRLAAERSGATVRRIALYRDLVTVSADEIVDRVRRAIRPVTRVLALTWVHSSTGLKLPLTRIAEAVRRVNATRDEGDRVLVVADAVHGFGIEDVTASGTGVDFFIAGCHKWLFGPRGTGIAWAHPSAWAALRPIIPSFIDDGAWEAWRSYEEPAGPTTASAMTPGGFKPFEHQWALARAFDFHQAIGKARVQARTHELAAALKDGLAALSHVRLHTPRDPELSSGIVSFEVAGLNAWEAVDRLRARKIIATVTPYAVRYVRLTPSICNLPGEIDAALRAVRDLG